MLEHLIKSLPEERTLALRHELKLLNRAASHAFQDPDDRAMAHVSDFQGMSGKPFHEQPVTKAD